MNIESGSRLSISPEFNVVLFGFLLSYPWEFLQTPFYLNMAQAKHWSAVKLCSLAAMGDAIIMLLAFWLAAAFGRTRQWLLEPHARDVSVFMTFGVTATIVIEWVAARADWGWRYSEMMPVVPVFGVGWVPLLMWLILPLIVIWFCRRQIAGAIALAADS